MSDLLRDLPPGSRPNPAAALSVGLRLALGLAGLVLFSTLLLMLPVSSTRPLAFNEALFTSVSALTVTGLNLITPAVDLTFFGQIVLLLLIQVGGIGLMVMTVVIFQLLGRRITLIDRFALRNMFGSLVPGAVLGLVSRVLLAVLAFEGLGALLLWLHWREMFNGRTAAWYAVFHSVSAFCNAGFDLFSGRPDWEGIPSDGISLAILGGLILIGSLGVPVVADLLALWKDRRLTLHTRLTLGVVAVLVIGGWLGLFFAEGLRAGLLADEPWDRRLGLALFQSISARTAGFTGLPRFELLSPSSQLVMISLMFIGAAPASMGGGITTGTAVSLALALWAYVRGRPYPSIGRRAISEETIRRAAAVLTLSLVVVTIATWLLLITHPGVTVEDALFEVVSAFATCGLSLAFTGQLNLFGQAIIMLVMFWGRLGALTVVVALARPVVQPLVHYPEEQIMIG